VVVLFFGVFGAGVGVVAVELGLGDEVGAGALGDAEGAVVQAGADGHDAGAAFVVGRAHYP
jgi:hypothetical protein